jgi:FKBP-type peptidyl-prolyl cis-trans isomerase
MFKKIIFAFFVLAAFFYAGCTKSSSSTSCGKSESTLVAADSEVVNIQTYLTANGRTAIKDPRGFFYSITAAGTGSTNPSICSKVYVKYAGYLFSGFKFTENLVGSTFNLSDLIVGWQMGMEKITAGGSITLYIPPSLGYGTNVNGNIPANSYLIFSVQLVQVL